MARWLIARREIIGPVHKVLEQLTSTTQELLQAATGGLPTQPAGDGSFPLPLTGRRAGMEAHGWVRATIGPALQNDYWVSIPLRWEPDGHALLPSFQGHLELEELSPLRSELVFVGQYRPPLGPLGSLGDLTVMDGVANRTAEDLIAGLARGITAAVTGEQQPPSAPAERGLTVGDVMTRDAVTFDADVPLRTAAAVLLRSGFSGAPVIGANGELIGVLSESDLLVREARPPRGRGGKADARRDALVAGDACTRPAVTTDIGASVRDAARLMLARDVARLVVLDAAKPVGLVTRHDVLKALHRQDAAVAADVERLLCCRDLESTVDASVEDGCVTLSGVLPDPAEREALVKEIAELDGVFDVTVIDPAEAAFTG